MCNQAGCRLPAPKKGVGTRRRARLILSWGARCQLKGAAWEGLLDFCTSPC